MDLVMRESADYVL